MPDMNPRFASLLRFLGSAQFAMILILVGVVAMIAGVYLDVTNDLLTAQSAVYGSTWFLAYLALVCLNLIVSVVNRFPLRRRHLPFVTTHASIVLMLVGTAISDFGYEGMLYVQEGGRSNELVMPNYQVAVKWARGEESGSARGDEPRFVEKQVPLPETIYLAGRRILSGEGGRPEIGIVEYLRKGVEDPVLTRGGAGDPPGIQLQISGYGKVLNAFLLSHSLEHRRKDLGPVETEIVVFNSQALLERRKKALDKPVNTLTVIPHGSLEPVVIPLPESLDKPVPCGPGLTARVVAFHLRAQVTSGGLINEPRGRLNPAAIVEIASGSTKESHTVFSVYPDFNVVKGKTGRGLVKRTYLQVASAMTKPLVSLLVGPKRDMYVQLSAHVGRGPAFPCPVGKTIGLGDFKLDLVVKHFEENAATSVRYREARPGEEGNPCIKLAVAQGGQALHRWLALGRSARMELAGKPLLLGFGNQVKDLPFTVTLKEFSLDYYPGSRRPAGYRSRVEVEADGESKGKRTTEIAMNRPLDFMGFRLFQSSYILGERGKPDVTVLSVSYDPGVDIVYIAFVLIIFGVGWYIRSGRPMRRAEENGEAGDGKPAQAESR